MQRALLRPYVTIGIAVLCAGIIAVPATAPPMRGAQARAVQLANGEDVAFIMGISGDPIPSQQYVDITNELFVQPHFPGYDPQALFTPEGASEIFTPVKSLTLDESQAQGVTILKDAIEQQVADGNHVAVLGSSQSSTISSMTMTELAADHVPNSDVGFVLLMNPSAPNGGILERLDGLTVPSLGITFNGATPDDLYPTTIYTQAYDEADVPRYPIDFLSDLNSILGIQFGQPPQDLTAKDLLPVADGGKAIELPTVGDTMTTYYMIPTENLPLLDLVRVIPGVGNPLADLLQPILTPLVNLGYGDPDFGWSTGPANVPTEFGLFPAPDMVLKTLEEMGEGIPKGIQAAIADVESSGPSDLSSLLTPAPLSLSGLMDALSADPLGELTNIVNALIGAFSTAYAALLPTADYLTALATSVPAYDASLFVDGLQAGDLLAAIGQPLATNTYLYTLTAGFEIFTLINTFETIGDQLSSLIPS